MKRIFLAIEVPDKIKKFLQAKLKEINAGNWREISNDNLHITLIFFGNLDDDELEKLKNNLSQIKFNRFKIKLSQIIRKKDMLWACVKENSELENLYKTVLEKTKWDPSPRPRRVQDDGKRKASRVQDDSFENHQRFAPHITLAKTKKDFKFLKKPLELEFLVKEIILLESKINHRVARYYPVRSFVAKAAAQDDEK